MGTGRRGFPSPNVEWWALRSINKFNFYRKAWAWRAKTMMQLSASSGHPFSDTFLGSERIWCSLPLTKLSHSLQGSHSTNHIPIALVTLAFCCCCYFCLNSQDINSLQQLKMGILHHFQVVKLSSQVMCHTVEFQLALKAQNLISGTINVGK